MMRKELVLEPIALALFSGMWRTNGENICFNVLEKSMPIQRAVVMNRNASTEWR